MNEQTIRSASPADAPRLLEIYSYYVRNTAITFEIDVPSLREFEERIRSTMQRYPYLVIEEHGQVLGYAYAGVFKDRAAYDWACELTIYIDHTVLGRGLGGRLYAALEDALKEMGMLNLYACIGYPDAEDEYLTRNSAEFHAHLGFVTIGEFHQCGYKFDRWYSMIWMEKIVGEHTPNQKPVRPYSEISARTSSGLRRCVSN